MRGSSPRVWGQDLDSEYYLWPSRIIPTRMGTRTTMTALSLCRWDHPHAYGDKRTAGKTTDFAKGSSPRVWGQATWNTSPSCEGRIIPTRMGTSHICSLLSFPSWDHPHAYGDKTKEIKENSGFAKSTA